MGHAPSDFPPRPPHHWARHAGAFAEAFIAWFDLTHLLTNQVRTAARLVYRPGMSSIRLGKLDPALTLIEAVEGAMGTAFRNAVYAGRQHPLERNVNRVVGEAQARAKDREVASGKPAEPVGWGRDFDELWPKETRALVRERLGIKTWGDALVFMANEWKSLAPEAQLSAMGRLRFNGIDFEELSVQLMREAEAVLAAESKELAAANAPSGSSTGLGHAHTNPSANWRSPTWYRVATAGALYPDLLRTRFEAGGSPLVREPRGKRFVFEFESVCATWPEWASLLRERLASMHPKELRRKRRKKTK